MRQLVKVKKICMALACFIILSSCTSAGRFNSLSLGMSKQEAIEIIGREPNSISSQGGREYLLYKYIYQDFFSNFKEYYIRIVDDKVKSYGMVDTSARENNNNKAIKELGEFLGTVFSPNGNRSRGSDFCRGFEEGYLSIAGSSSAVPPCSGAPARPGATEFQAGIRAGVKSANNRGRW